MNLVRLAALILLAASLGAAQQHRIAEADRLAREVREEFLHAWNGYKTYAWGTDGLLPLSKKGYVTYGGPLLLTPVDAFDTMLLMGLTAEAEETKRLILSSLTFDQDISVKNFEIVIRVLGGLLTAHQMTGEPRFLSLAEDLGRRLLPVFDSPTGLPYVNVNLRTGAVERTHTNPAETGTLLIEFGTLSKLTGNDVYYKKAKRALTETFRRRSAIGLAGESFDARTGKWIGTDSHVGGMIDSYYEYLYKCWKLFGDEDCKRMWEESIAAVNRYCADTVRGMFWYARVDMNTGRRRHRVFGGLEAFMPGLLALSGDTARAAALQRSCEAMWNRYGVEPEMYDYAADSVRYGRYPLRPEIIESAYYLYRITGDTAYQHMGASFFRALRRHCRTEAGYAELADVVTKRQHDMMESFFLAETMKYCYLLFADPSLIDLRSVVFNTEAHPIRKSW